MNLKSFGYHHVLNGIKGWESSGFSPWVVDQWLARHPNAVKVAFLQDLPVTRSKGFNLIPKRKILQRILEDIVGLLELLDSTLSSMIFFWILLEYVEDYWILWPAEVAISGSHSVRHLESMWKFHVLRQTTTRQPSTVDPLPTGQKALTASAEGPTTTSSRRIEAQQTWSKLMLHGLHQELPVYNAS